MSEDWDHEAYKSARSMLAEFVDTVASMAEDGNVSDNLNDYPGGDRYHNENNHPGYTLSVAADLLDQLHKDLETDAGLWEGLQPMDAVCCQATYTYANAVISRWREYIGDLNEALDSPTIEVGEHRAIRAKLWVLLVCSHGADRPALMKCNGVEHTALKDLEIGSVDGCRVLADWLEEHGKADTEMRDALLAWDDVSRGLADALDDDTDMEEVS